MDDITISPMVYVLELERSKYYIGITMNLNLRYAQHEQGSGAGWTKLHKPVRIVEVIPHATKELENEIALRYMDQYGRENVRGGYYCKV
jgi:predicted GIY-YIG superfamily endonuclease